VQRGLMSFDDRQELLGHKSGALLPSFTARSAKHRVHDQVLGKLLSRSASPAAHS